MKTRFLNSHYDRESGTSIALIGKGDYIYMGRTVLKEEDADIESSFAGCDFAEYKAEIKLAKNEYEGAQLKLKHMEEVYDRLAALSEFEEYKNTKPMRHFRKRIALQKREILRKKDLLDYIVDAYPTFVENRLRKARELPKALEIKRAQTEAIKELEDDNS